MADTKESFEILEDASGNGVACTDSTAGATATGKRGPTVFGFKDPSGNLDLPKTNASGAVITDGSGVTQPVSAASLPLPTGAATSANQTTSLTRIGDLTETAPVSDTASSGLNGRLQRIAQRLTSLISLFPSSIGQKIKSDSLSVTIASDQGNIPVAVDPITVIGFDTYRAALISNAASAGSKNPIFLIRNPIASGKVFYIRSIKVGISVTNVTVDFSLFSNPTITTNGTTVNSFEANIGYGQPTAKALCSSLPTISANGNLLAVTSIGQNTAGSELIFEFGIAIQPGNSILMTADPSSNNRSVSFAVTWKEQ